MYDDVMAAINITAKITKMISKRGGKWQAADQVCLSLINLDLKWLLLYTGGVLFLVEWCTRKLWCPSIILYNIAHDHYTDIYSKTNILIYLFVGWRNC